MSNPILKYDQSTQAGPVTLIAINSQAGAQWFGQFASSGYLGVGSTLALIPTTLVQKDDLVQLTTRMFTTDSLNPVFAVASIAIGVGVWITSQTSMAIGTSGKSCSVFWKLDRTPL